MLRWTTAQQRRAEEVAEASGDQSEDPDDQDEEDQDGNKSGWTTPSQPRPNAGKSRRKITPQLSRGRLRTPTRPPATPGSALTPSRAQPSSQTRSGGRVPNLKVKAKKKRRQVSSGSADPDEEPTPIPHQRRIRSRPQSPHLLWSLDPIRNLVGVGGWTLRRRLLRKRCSLSSRPDQFSVSGLHRLL